MLEPSLPAIIADNTARTFHATNSLTEEIIQLRKELKLQSIVLARIMAQLDPLFVIPEDHPLRRKDSDKIAEEVLRKLRAEYAASNSGETL